MKGSPMKIGVLALQGAFAEHVRALAALPDVQAVEVRKRADFHDSLAGLVIPGGESTVMAKLLVDLRLLEPVTAAIRRGMPVFGTCAGLILLARDVENSAAPRIGLLDVTVRRNSYGRQLDSFASRADFAGMPGLPMVFIRAPGIVRVGAGVERLASVDGRAVAVRQANMLGVAFHPELTADPRIHGYFREMVMDSLDTRRQDRYRYQAKFAG